MDAIQIPYPNKTPSRRSAADGEEVFCIIRKRWLKSTPEEWVRQNFLLYLTEVLAYSPALIAVEKTVKLGELNKRFDILVYNQKHQPHIIVECKSVKVAITPDVLSQAMRYYTVIQSAYLVITNGPISFAFIRKDDDLIPIHQLPPY